MTARPLIASEPHHIEDLSDELAQVAGRNAGARATELGFSDAEVDDHAAHARAVALREASADLGLSPLTLTEGEERQRIEEEEEEDGAERAAVLGAVLSDVRQVAIRAEAQALSQPAPLVVMCRQCGESRLPDEACDCHALASCDLCDAKLPRDLVSPGGDHYVRGNNCDGYEAYPSCCIFCRMEADGGRFHATKTAEIADLLGQIHEIDIVRTEHFVAIAARLIRMVRGGR